MNKFSKTLVALAGLVVAIGLTTPANADVSIFTEHQVVHMFQHGTNNNQDVQFPTGKVPYLGQIGLEYDITNKISTSISYIHRSNADLTGQDEYNYNGVALGLKYTHCIAKCK